MSQLRFNETNPFPLLYLLPTQCESPVCGPDGAAVCGSEGAALRYRAALRHPVQRYTTVPVHLYRAAVPVPVLVPVLVPLKQKSRPGLTGPRSAKFSPGSSTRNFLSSPG